MRQLVSVVSDGALRYFIHDGGEAIQVAQLVDPGVDVGAVIEIGVSLGSLYNKVPLDGLVGGLVKPAKSAPKAVAPAPAALAPPPEEPQSAKVTYARTNISVDEIIDYITKHPGVRSTQIAADLLPGKTRPGATKPRQQIDNKLRNLTARHEANGTEAPVHRRQLGPMHVGWYPGPAPTDVGPANDDAGDMSDAPVTD